MITQVQFDSFGLNYKCYNYYETTFAKTGLKVPDSATRITKLSKLGNEKQGITGTIDEIYKISQKSEYKPSSFATVKPKDKIYFSSSSPFPPLLLGRMGLDLKRTTLLKSADKIVTDFKMSNYCSPYNLRLISINVQLKSVYCINLTYGTTHSLAELKKLVLSAQNIDPNFALYLFLPKADIELMDLINNNASKIVNPIEFIKYINDKLPEITDDEFESVKSMLLAKDKQSVVTGINLIPFYNLSKRIPDLVSIMMKCNRPKLVTTDYILFILGLTAYQLEQASGNFRVFFAIMADVMKNNIIMDPSLRTKIRQIMSVELCERISSEYKEELTRLDLQIQLNDKIRETDSSNTEVEGS